MAISTWSFMQKLLPAEDLRIALLEKSINVARNAQLLQSLKKKKSHLFSRKIRVIE